ncbi:MAG: hypothetical protein Q4F98_01610 [Lachnospiraceae bacterium]|nr:hypothetical protein [Lachnospiraceae bacterium]
MKKRTKKLLSLTLAVMLAVSSGSVVSAAEPSAKMQSTETKKAQKQSLQAGRNIVNAVKQVKENRLSTKSVSAKANEPNLVNGKIPVVMIKDGYEDVNEIGQILLFSKNGTVNNHYQYSQPLKLKAKGTVDFAVSYVAKSDTAEERPIMFGLFYDEELTRPVDSYNYCNKVDDTQSRIFKVPKAGTYYLGIYLNAYESDSYNAGWGVFAAAGYYNGADRTLSNKKRIVVGQKDGQTNYFKYKATQTGYVTALSDKDSKYAVRVALCNSKKKAYSDYTSVGYGPTYGVTKGNTYYFKVQSSYNNNGGFFFRVNNNKVTEKSGQSKSKAVALKKGRTANGTIQAGSSKADWYKITLSSKKSVKILWKAKTNNQMKVTIYQGSRTVGTRSLSYYDSAITLKSVGKWSKGTYYVKVYRGDSKSSGWYSLKLQ